MLENLQFSREKTVILRSWTYQKPLTVDHEILAQKMYQIFSEANRKIFYNHTSKTDTNMVALSHRIYYQEKLVVEFLKDQYLAL